MQAFIFPGQGSQKVGMGADLFDHHKERVETASDILGYCIKTLCLEDPRSELGLTQYTQPALFTVSALTYLDHIDKQGSKPDVVAGHSLGEYNALFAAGAFTFEDGLTLVKKRAELMSKANGGAMAAVMGLSASELENLLAEEAFLGLDIASVNSSKQVVISGLPELISKAATYFEDSDTQCYPLNVSAAFHSRYMKPAADEFYNSLCKVDFLAHQLPVISNVFARPYDQTESPRILASQIYSPVKWQESVQYMMAMGADNFLEIGPGSVLTNMQKNIVANPSLKLVGDGVVPNSNTVKSGISGSELENLAEQQAQIRVDENLASKLASDWNNLHPIGTEVELAGLGGRYKTRSEAMMLFGDKAAIYLVGKNGFYPLASVHTPS